MKRFRFRFQRVLELKESVEESRKIALGEAVEVLNREQLQLDRLQQTRQLYLEASRGAPAARLDSPLLGLNASYLQRLQREIEEQKGHIGQVEAIVAERRERLLEATKERRVYEILKEKALEAHRKEQQRQERIQLDEVGEQLYARRRSEDGERNL